ncbi:helix-turn-helix domain-containing protein [Cellulosilyticum lentocellum]|uniref:Helix-turn-helix domain protein n=1 Tax=Cellulosilyticum lentocellum (strain ATCC 49066 / DSM 5427 / NCIMB 11756 / RHM5) TaxID=642492 RepID=F2JNZ1_CELLD|nr:helix-turn-helix transcriptional regulator [Cellulosilyticum lentocellum]ADZ83605.1 helix-turn-helix domain protein [Cellulosilyticum lentocellum DSM 5427]
MDISKEIRILLAQEDLKVSDLARLMDTSHQNITNILNKNNPTISKVEEMANALGYKMNITFEKVAE